MKWLKALAGLVVVAGFLYGVWALKGKLASAEPSTGKSVTATLAAGTPVNMILLTPLDSGGVKEGKEVKFVVNEDVRSPEGAVVIKQGALATGKVSQSRAGSIGGALANQPARLAVIFDKVESLAGQVALACQKAGEDYDFTQANTRLEGNSNAVDAVTDPEARDYVVSLARQIALGEQAPPEEKAKAEKQLKELSQRYGLKSTQELLNGPQDASHPPKDVSSLLQSVQKGDLKGLTGVDVLLVARAASEIVDLGSGLDKSLRGMLKGSNIHAKIGTPVTAYLAKTVTAKVKV